MKILITSGGTSEKIDQVRSITNHSTGQLGSILARYFSEKGDEVTLITTKKAIKPEARSNLTIQLIENVNDLLETLEPLVKTHQVLIHAMAVSDYTPVYMADFEQVQKARDLQAFLHQENQESKISSSSDYQVLFLKKTPKIISYVKDWNPTISLIGFKLLVDVSREELLDVARRSLIHNQADLIVANDLADIGTEQHRAYLVERDKVTPVATKEEIAQTLYSYIHRRKAL
ncbi:phosphopantothenate--cysteine ligase [Streptococcus himalayensis]|nr:phosphopantothenate--cysteine ligase [Streptococcus himalayensis]